MTAWQYDIRPITEPGKCGLCKRSALYTIRAWASNAEAAHSVSRCLQCAAASAFKLGLPWPVVGA